MEEDRSPHVIIYAFFILGVALVMGLIVLLALITPSTEAGTLDPIFIH